MLKYQAEVKQLKSELSVSEETISRLSQQVKEFTEKQTTLTQELEAQRVRNDVSNCTYLRFVLFLLNTISTKQTALFVYLQYYGII